LRRLVLAACLVASGPALAKPLAYPTARRDAHVETFQGTEVADPYVWLEDLDSPETKAWVQAENELTRSVLDRLPERQRFADRLAELWKFERWGTPVHEGDRWFWTYNDGTRDQPVLVVADRADGSPRVLLDPNTWSEDGTVSLAEWAPSRDGRYVAYAMADGGSDWRTLKVVDVATGHVLDDELEWVKFSDIAWAPDSAGFFVSRFPAPTSDAFEERLANQSVWYHRVGTPQADDVLVHDDPAHPDRGFAATVTEDGRRLFLDVTEGTEDKDRQYWFDLADLHLDARGGRAGGTLHVLLDDFDAAYALLGEDGDRVWFRTDKDAPRGRVVAIDLAHPEPSAWTTVVPEQEGTLEQAALLGGRLVLSYLERAHGRLVLREQDGRPVRDVTLPGLVSVADLSGHPDDPDAFFGVTGFTTPGEVWRLHVADGEAEVLRAPKVGFAPDDYVTEQIEVPSRDGTTVLAFVVHRRDLDLSKPHPTLLYGYGGFNIPLTPGFKVDNLAWVERGGLFVVANLRGGGEFGQDWHLAGTKLRKQNVFDDVIAVAEGLVARGWTTPRQLGLHGRSNGGLLAGAVLVQRPDLFGAVIPGVGVLDMLKYHRWTIGWAWASDYGTADESPEMFSYLRAYSPVHNADPARYPATLITTADHDDRVVPAHSYKFAAALQHAQQGRAPVLIRIETRAGHGAQTPVSMLVEEQADKLAFLAKYLGL
jgi:prolyl oligopeptidase